MSARKPKRSGCIGCGGPCTTPCVDNHGGKYLGCDSGCRFAAAPVTDADALRARLAAAEGRVAELEAALRKLDGFCEHCDSEPWTVRKKFGSELENVCVECASK